jgi:hypothetical protein
VTLLPKALVGNVAWAIGLAYGVMSQGVPEARAAEEVGADLAAAARSGVRPEECGGASRVHASRWERAKIPGLGRYCDLLARGYASLSTAPDVSARNAEAAEAALPGLPAPLVLRARAEVRRGAVVEAWALFERARALSPKSLDAPATLHDFATCGLGSGHPAEALMAYRALVPRADLLGDRWEELSVFVEAAALATSVSKDSLAESIGYVTEARRRGTLPGMGDAVLAALALALDRAGRSAEAASVAREAAGPSWLEAERAAEAGGKHSLLPALPPNEIDAMIAIVAEPGDRELALDRWQSYLASPAGKTGQFAAHARAHRDALARGKGAP